MPKEETVELKPNDAKLWKKRYETSVMAWDSSDHKQECENVVRYLHNDFTHVKNRTVVRNPSSRGISEVFLNQFFISLKTLIPLVIAHN